MSALSSVPALSLAAGMTLSSGGLVLAADVDEGGFLDVAVYLHGSIELLAVDPAAIAAGHSFEVRA